MRNDQLAAILTDLASTVKGLVQRQEEQEALLHEIITSRPIADDPQAMIDASPVVTVDHESDQPLTLWWNEIGFTFMPGPNSVPGIFAKQYKNHIRDVEFQKKNQKLLENKDYLSSQLSRMASKAKLE